MTPASARAAIESNLARYEANGDARAARAARVMLAALSAPEAPTAPVWLSCEGCGMAHPPGAPGCYECGGKLSGAHARDADCTLDGADVCRGCGVYHGDPCPGCEGRGYHGEGCPAL